MKTNITLEEALARAEAISPDLREKIQWSVDLLRKAERIAKLYSDEGFYVAFSGGKDSQAVYHIAELSGVAFTATYAVTTCDPPELIRFIRAHYPEVSFTNPKESIYHRCLNSHSGMLPTRVVRWCCTDFKEHLGSNRVVLTGVRKLESVKRSKRNEVEVTDRPFSGTIEEFESFRENKFESRRKKKDTDDFLNFRCVKGKDSLVVMPIIYWSEKQVWDFLNRVVTVSHCPLYDEGFKRIGCSICPLSSYTTKVQEARRYPHRKHKWIEVILINYSRNPSYVDKYLPSGVSEFKTDLPKETVESFGGKYPQRWIESAEAYFDYWIRGVSYDKWFSDTYRQLKMFDEK